MKRAFQFGWAIMILLMAGQPVLAATACEMGFASSHATCSMGMSEMGPDCPMAQGLAADCTQDCCEHAAPKAAVLPAAPAKPRPLLAAALSSSICELHPAPAAQPHRQSETASASSPPRYLLNRVFRI